MRTLLVISLYTGLFSALFQSSLPAEPAALQDTTSRWKTISYPEAPSWRKGLSRSSILIENSTKAGVICTLQYFLSSDEDRKDNDNVQPEAVAAELHLNKERPIRLEGSVQSQLYEGNGPLQYREHSTTHTFLIPWSSNQFDDAWIYLTLQDRKLLVELPYGLISKFDESGTIGNSKLKSPALPFTKQELGPKDLILPWDHVTYKSANLGNNVSVDVKLANPADAFAELGLSGFEGDVRKPEAGIMAAWPGGNESRAECISLSLTRSGTYRKQRFRFGRAPYDERRLCTLRIAVGADHFSLVVPSSLVFFAHGHADYPGGTFQLAGESKWGRDD